MKPGDFIYMIPGQPPLSFIKEAPGQYTVRCEERGEAGAYWRELGELTVVFKSAQRLFIYKRAIKHFDLD